MSHASMSHVSITRYPRLAREPLALTTPLLRIAAMVAAAGLALLAGGSARAEDFDCKSAKRAAEKTVCAHDYLRRLDDRTATLYGLLWARLNDMNREGLHDHQVAFLERRNACGGSEHCVAKTYRTQIGELSEQLARNPVR